MISSLFKLLLLASAAIACDDDCLYEFEPPVLSIKNFKSSFKVRLTAKPKHKVQLFFDDKPQILQFSSCGVTFTENNYNHWQEISVIANVANFTTQGVSQTFDIKSQTLSTDKDFNEKSCPYSGKVDYKRAKICTSWGDPHVTTFDGIRYNHFEDETFYLVKSDQLVIQTLTGQCTHNPKASCNKAIAVWYGNAVIIVDTRVSGSLLGIRGTKTSTFAVTEKNGKYKITFPNGKVKLKLPHRNQISFEVLLNPVFDGIGGLCNNFNKKALIGRDGKTYTNAQGDAFAKTWKVSKASSLFDMNNPVHALSKPGSPYYTCDLKRKLYDSPLPGMTTIPKYNPAHLLSPLVNCKNKRIDADNQAYEELSKKLCDSFIPKSCAGVPHVEEANYKKACLTEFKLANYLDTYHALQEQFNSQCRTITKQPVSCGDKVKCSGNGDCNQKGCKCKKGFGGADCSIAIASKFYCF